MRASIIALLLSANTVAAYNCLFIGASFFVPPSQTLASLAAAAGLSHSQVDVFSPGGTGQPMALWNNVDKSNAIKTYLDAGDVDMFAMAGPTEGNELWIDYALTKNPNTKIMIGMTWLDFPTRYDAVTYASTTRESMAGVAPSMASLRAKYPDVTILDNPYGLGVAQLRLMFDAGAVPDILPSKMTGDDWDDRANCIYYDEKGHGGDILHDLVGLFYLNRIYNVDLSTYASPLTWSTDLNGAAKFVLDAYDAGNFCGSTLCPTPAGYMRPAAGVTLTGTSGASTTAMTFTAVAGAVVLAL